MSREQINQIVKELVSDGIHSDCEAYDIAQNVLFDEPGMKEGIIKHFRVSDPVGWLADRIC